MKTAAIKLGPLYVHWYGVIVALALIAGLLVSIGMARLRRERADPLAGILLLGLLAGVIGARVWYVAFSRDFYAPDPARVFAVWEGGLALHGGLLGGMLATLIYTWSSELDFWTWADICVPGLILAQAIGRVGDVVNNQAFGQPTTGSPAAIIPYENRPAEYLAYSHFQPTAAYEGVWDLLVFLLLISLTLIQRGGRRILPAGSIFAAYLILYSIGRIPLEGMRVDSLYLGSVRVAQLASVIFIGLGILVYVARVLKPREPVPEPVAVAPAQPTQAYLVAAMRGSQMRQETSAVQLPAWDTAFIPPQLGGNGRATVTTPLPLLPEAPPMPPGGTGVDERPHAEEAS